mgnify:FL=1
MLFRSQYAVTVTDVTNENSVGATTDANAAANTLSEASVDDAEVGITASATDEDASDDVTYSMTIGTSACAGWFDIGASDGIVRVDGTNELDYESASTCTVTVTSTSDDGSTSTADFTITLTDFDEFDVTSPSDIDSDSNSVSENVTNGASAEITAYAYDGDGTN